MDMMMKIIGNVAKLGMGFALKAFGGFASGLAFGLDNLESRTAVRFGNKPSPAISFGESHRLRTVLNCRACPDWSHSRHPSAPPQTARRCVGIAAIWSEQKRHRMSGRGRGTRPKSERRAAGTRDAYPYHAAVAGRQPYRAGGRMSSRAVRIRFSGYNASVMPQILSKYVRRCYIIHVTPLFSTLLMLQIIRWQ